MATTQNKNAGKTPNKKPVATKKTAGKAKPQTANQSGASKGSVYTKPEVRERIKKQVTAGSDGGAPGQWSARKGNIVTEKYKKAGGGFEEELRGKGSKKQAEIKDKAASKAKSSASKEKASADKSKKPAQPKTKAEKKPLAKTDATTKTKPAAKAQTADKPAAKPAAKAATKTKAKAATKTAAKKAVKAK